MSKYETTFESLPSKVEKLLKEVEELTVMVKDIRERTGQNLSSPCNTFGGRNVMTTEQVCKLLDRSKATIYRMIARGELPCIKRGNKLVFYEDEMMAWLEKGRRKTTDELFAEAREYLHSDFLSV